VALDFSIDETDLRGYIAWYDPLFATSQLMTKVGVTSVQADHANITLSAGTITFNDPLPNLDRIDEATFPLDHKFTIPTTAGKGVNIYIIDSGININHVDFGGRARCGAAFCSSLGCSDCLDRNGHGTNVAGIAGGSTFGVAKKSNLIAVKVCEGDECISSIQTSNIIVGMLFVFYQHLADNKKRTVVNISLGGPFNPVTNLLVKVLTSVGIHVVAAAGNSGIDANLVSPASAPEAITVGNINSLTTFDRLAVEFTTNFGPRIDVFAPGVNIISAGHLSTTDLSVLSGTSQAAPHVAGTVALIISSKGNLTPADMSQRIIDLSTKDVIQGPLLNSPNRVLRVPSK
jgi:subtilisin family serine protease